MNTTHKLSSRQLPHAFFDTCLYWGNTGASSQRIQHINPTNGLPPPTLKVNEVRDEHIPKHSPTGRRVANFGFAQNVNETGVDLNSIPLSAVKRVEILKDGASAIYGSDAIADVVNVILKKDFEIHILVMIPPAMIADMIIHRKCRHYLHLGVMEFSHRENA